MHINASPPSQRSQTNEAFSFTTADDQSDRDPVQWILEGSEHGTWAPKTWHRGPPSYGEHGVFAMRNADFDKWGFCRDKW